ncbi:response regulator transcription factor [Carboxylicivirga sediminis]|uniref:Phosphate regulon transcriptional regulatory protein PhoB n=1 Tax=Carboxylicivirga sediminis TaxID=2006564 RepID=A0A941F6Q0_9BACT|nr:response regulator transcription factor [Carboxylicivirga sediminis]MBR8537881.1 response regulator transcription factor [Carboxylicivirga sediminis]
MMKRILVVEDEPDMQSGIKDNLEFEGYDVDTASDGKEGLQKILTDSFDLVLLDVMLPHISGFDVCKKVRLENNNTPIIFLTAKGEEIDKVIGLESGGDDYLTKPFSLRELLARVKAVLRRTEMQNPSATNHEMQVGRLKVDFSTYTAWVDGEQVKMTSKEFEILQYLLKHKNATISRDSLLDNVWGYDFQPTARTIDNFILKLRHKIEDNPNEPQIIITVHGMGYRLVHS